MNSLYDRVALTVAGAGAGLVTRQARNTLIGAWCVLTLLIGTRVGIQALVYVWKKSGRSVTYPCLDLHKYSRTHTQSPDASILL